MARQPAISDGQFIAFVERQDEPISMRFISNNLPMNYRLVLDRIKKLSNESPKKLYTKKITDETTVKVLVSTKPINNAGGPQKLSGNGDKKLLEAARFLDEVFGLVNEADETVFGKVGARMSDEERKKLRECIEHVRKATE